MTRPPVPHAQPLGHEVAAHEATPRPIATAAARRPAWRVILTLCANAVGAASAAVFAYSSLHFYLQSHRPIGIVFALQQSLVAVVYLTRRPARRVTHRLDDWCLAFVGTFIGVLLRPDGEHAAWGIWAGTLLQLVGAAVVVACLVSLGRSFGFAAGDRGVVTRGAYHLVRHPMYAAYMLLGSGYLLQSLSLTNAVIVVIGTLCNGGRALAEERLLTVNPDYLVYRRRVPRRIVLGLW